MWLWNKRFLPTCLPGSNFSVLSSHSSQTGLHQLYLMKPNSSILITAWYPTPSQRSAGVWWLILVCPETFTKWAHPTTSTKLVSVLTQWTKLSLTWWLPQNLTSDILCTKALSVAEPNRQSWESGMYWTALSLLLIYPSQILVITGFGMNLDSFYVHPGQAEAATNCELLCSSK